MWLALSLLGDDVTEYEDLSMGVSLAGDALGDLEGDRVPPGLVDFRWKLILLQLARCAVILSSGILPLVSGPQRTSLPVKI